MILHTPIDVSIGYFWKDTTNFHLESKGRSKRGVRFPQKYKCLEEIKETPIVKEFFRSVRTIYTSEYLYATDGETYLITNEHYCRKFADGVKIYSRKYSEIKKFWENTEQFHAQRNETKSKGVLFPEKFEDLNKLKDSLLIIDYLYMIPYLSTSEYLCVTDGENYLMTDERIFFIDDRGCHSLYWLDFWYTVKNSLFSPAKIVLTPGFNSKWTGQYTITTSYVVSESYIRSEVYNREERIKQAKKYLEQKEQEKEQKKQQDEIETRKRQEELQRKQQQQAETTRVRNEKIAKEKMPPPEYCATCGESIWLLQETSPNMCSAIWKCSHCGKFSRVLSTDLRPASTAQRAPIPKDVQREVWRRDEGRCTECGNKEALEFDHIIPVSKGGSDTARNIQLLCQECNRKKGASNPGDF